MVVEAEQLLRRGLVAYEDTIANSDRRTQGSYTEGGKKLLVVGLQTCLAFAMRRKCAFLKSTALEVSIPEYMSFTGRKQIYLQ